MAQHRARAARLHRCEKPAGSRQTGVADGVHAAVDAVKATPADTKADGLIVEPARVEFLDGEDAPLLPRGCGDRDIRASVE
jgi:hypothetical protein